MIEIINQPVLGDAKTVKKIPVHAWELIPYKERVMDNPDWAFIIFREMNKNTNERDQTYKVEGKNVYIGRWYR